MNKVRPDTAKAASIELCVILQPRFAMADLVKITELLQVANDIAGDELWKWHYCSEQGSVVIADNGMVLSTLRDTRSVKLPDQILLLKGAPETKISDASLLSLLGECYKRNRPVFEHPLPAANTSPKLAEVMTSMILPHLTPQQADTFLEKLDSIHSPPSIRDSRIQRALLLMQQNLEHPLDKHALAAGAYVSVRQLERLFQRYLGETPSRYYTRLRLSAAKRMLQQTNLQIAEIAQTCGFGSASHFSKIYQQYHGVTPSQEMAYKVEKN